MTKFTVMEWVLAIALIVMVVAYIRRRREEGNDNTAEGKTSRNIDRRVRACQNQIKLISNMYMNRGVLRKSEIIEDTLVETAFMISSLDSVIELESARGVLTEISINVYRKELQTIRDMFEKLALEAENE